MVNVAWPVVSHQLKYRAHFYNLTLFKPGLLRAYETLKLNNFKIVTAMITKFSDFVLKFI